MNSDIRHFPLAQFLFINMVKKSMHREKRGIMANSERIMLIDDNEITLRSLSKALEMNGFPNHKFDNPITALKNYNPDTYPIVVSDFRMPQLNGIELLNYIKAKNSKVKMIIYTGFPCEKISHQIISLGAREFYKPINLEQLLGCLEKMKIEINKLKNIKEEK